MPYCSKCGSETVATAKFCKRCGHELKAGTEEERPKEAIGQISNDKPRVKNPTRLVALLILSVALLAGIVYGIVYLAERNWHSHSLVTFPDYNLYLALRFDAIGFDANNLTVIGNLYQSDLDGVTVLVADNREIKDLTGLEHCTNLTCLTLDGNQISNISALSGLTNLNDLYLKNNKISDVSSLSGLTDLTDLSLDNNTISDISALTGLTNLNDIHLKNNKISDIKPLVDNAGIGSDDWVWLDGNPLSTTSINTYIPELKARGVWVVYH